MSSRATWPELISHLRARAKRRDRYNLVLVAMPLATAHRDAPELARSLNAEYVDLDRAVIDHLRADDWEYHVEAERVGDLSEGRQLAIEVITALAEQLKRSRPLVIGNCNLLVRYEIDPVAQLLAASSRGLCVICVGGHVRDGAVFAHGVFKLTGAGVVPALELAANG